MQPVLETNRLVVFPSSKARKAAGLSAGAGGAATAAGATGGLEARTQAREPAEAAPVEVPKDSNAGVGLLCGYSSSSGSDAES